MIMEIVIEYYNTIILHFFNFFQFLSIFSTLDKISAARPLLMLAMPFRLKHQFEGINHAVFSKKYA